MTTAHSKEAMVRFILALTLVAAISAADLPEQARIALRNAAIPQLNSVIGNLNRELTNSYNAFQTVNRTCQVVLQREISQCTSCVTSKCEQRAKSACGPKGWEKVLAKGIDIVKSVPDVLTKKIPKAVFKDAPQKIVDVAKDVGGFLKDKVVNKVVDAGKKVVDAVGDVGKKIGSGISRAWRKVWGKRSLRGIHAIRQRRSEPSCSDLENNPNQACRTYLSSVYCSSCGFNPMTGCSGYAAAVNRLTNAQNARSWLDNLSNKDFNIVSVTWSGAFQSVRVRVQMFGKDFTMSMGTLNPYDLNNAGPAIARKAIDTFKA